MHSYVDRGLIKWGAFDALNGYTSMLSEMRYRLGKKPKPILSDDDYESLNRNLQAAIDNKTQLEIKYYYDGYFRVTFGSIAKLDFVNKQIILSTKEKLFAEDIVELRLQ